MHHTQEDKSEHIKFVDVRYLNKAVSSKIYKKYNWQCASDEQAKCTGVPGGAKSATACIMLYMASEK